jgi:alpha-tubulin suppressor-like RCC1 family protein
VLILILLKKNDGTIWSWGSNDGGQLATGTTNSSLIPLQISNTDNITQFSTGGYHSFYLTQNNSLFAWGYNGMGQLGNNTIISEYLPITVSCNILNMSEYSDNKLSK